MMQYKLPNASPRNACILSTPCIVHPWQHIPGLGKPGSGHRSTHTGKEHWEQMFDLRLFELALEKNFQSHNLTNTLFSS